MVTQCYNYIKMNKSAKTWLLFMMVPFFIGVLIHFIVPLEMIITANPKLEETYNGYKIEVQQNTVRALAFLNSRVITNRLQMYENIRSTFIRLFERGDIYETINLTDIVLNNGYEIANMNSTAGVDLNHSMWYSPNATSVDQLDEIGHQIYYSYVQVEPFIESIYTSNDEIYNGLLNLEAIINYHDHQFYFQYPSEAKPQFMSQNSSVINKYYTDSIQNQKQQKFKLTVFDMGKSVKLCTVIFVQGDTEPGGVVCLGLDIETVIKDITSVLGVPQFQLSTNHYYLVRPLYQFEGLEDPQIIANFTSNNLSQINIPDFEYLKLSENPLKADIFDGVRDYMLNIQRHEQTKTYYTIPIMTYNYDDSFQVAIYLVVLNNFAKAKLAEQSRNQRIAIIMIVPSVLLLILSILVTTLILRSILKKLDQALCLMGEYCSLIKRGDLQLQIPQYTETQDLKELFEELQKLNQLNKYADISYFNVPKPQRIIRFLKCLKLFDELGYDKTNLYQNICECYVDIGDMQNAIKFLRMSIDMTIEQIYGKPEQIDIIYQAKLHRKVKMDRNYRKREKIIKRKILRLCQILYMTYTSGNVTIQNELSQKAELLRKITYPDILNFQYIGCLFFIISCKIKTGDLTEVDQKMDILYELIKGYQQINQHEENCQAPPDVMYSYWNSLAGSLKMSQKKYIEAYDYYVKALQGNRFNPFIHKAVHAQMEKILQIHGISKDQLKKFKYIEQYKPRTQREYIFLIDVGKPEMSVQQVHNWKKKARKMAQHIFNKQIKSNDRISITEFCLDIKIVCNLIDKGNRQKMIKKQLLSSIKARDQTINALLLPCLNKSIERAKNLKKQKIFLIFYKGGYPVSGDQISEQIEDVENSKFLFFVDDTDIIKQKNQDFFVINFEHELDVDRILEQKVMKQADNIIYIL